MRRAALQFSFHIRRGAGSSFPCINIFAKDPLGHRQTGPLMFVRKFAVLAAASLIVVNCASTPERLPQLTEDVGSSLDAVGVITIGPWG